MPLIIQIGAGPGVPIFICKHFFTAVYFFALNLKKRLIEIETSINN